MRGKGVNLGNSTVQPQNQSKQLNFSYYGYYSEKADSRVLQDGAGNRREGSMDGPQKVLDAP